jgi:hypothetical protein
MTDEELKNAFLRSRGGVPAAPTQNSATPEPVAQPAARSEEAAPAKKKKKKAKPKPAKKAAKRPVDEPEKASSGEKAGKTPPHASSSRKPTSEKSPGSTTAKATPATPKKKGRRIVIEKSDAPDEDEVPPPSHAERHGWWIFKSAPKYKYLTPAVLRAIDKAPVKPSRWCYIVVHNSGTRQGNAKAFDYYHRHVRHMPNGLAYHFVIGNGTSSGNGAIEIGDRWKRQINGGHVHSDFLNNIALGICLVGDYNRDKPTKEQLEALDELIRYLRKRVGKKNHREAVVKAHKDINPVPTDCPGNKFPYHWLYTRFD